MNDSPNFERREPPGKWVSMGLTAFVHVGLIVFLLVGVRWESRPPASMEVQLVAAPTAPVAAPRPAPAPRPQPTPEPPKPEPKPEPPKPEPKPEPPKPELKPEPKPEPPKPAPDIATKAPEPKPEPPKPEPPKPPPPKPEPPKPPPPKPEPPKPEPPKPPPPKPEPPKPAPQPAQTPPDDYMAQRLAQELERAQIERLMRDDAARVAEARTAVPGGGALGDYEARIQAHIKRNIVLPPSVLGDPSAEFVVTQAPDGTVTSVRQLSSSGIPTLDAAIERAINRSSPLPLPTTQERPPRELRLTFRPLRD